MDDQSDSPQSPRENEANAQPSTLSTPQAAQPGPQIPTEPQEPYKQRNLPKISSSMLIPVIAIINVGFVILAVVVLALSAQHGTSTTTTSTTSILFQNNVSSFASCTNITRPGSYYATSNFKTNISSGPCIDVEADSVSIICNQNRILGSGPYGGVPPFTYGINIQNHTNVSVSGCRIANFSFGIFAANSHDIRIQNNNISQSTISGVLFKNTTGSSIKTNYITRSVSANGAVYLTQNSTNNTLQNNTIQFNSKVGIYVNSSNERFLNNYINNTPTSFYCSEPNGFEGSSFAFSNICFNNTHCNFIKCFGNNIPDTLRNITLGPSVASCGTIRHPGVYTLIGDVSGSEPTVFNAVLISCINIKANNVVLNCNNFEIVNASVAVNVTGQRNVTIENCRVNSANVGIELTNVTLSYLENSSVKNSKTGISLVGSDNNTLLNVQSFNNTNYGIYLQNSNFVGLQGFSLLFNKYGAYINSSVGTFVSQGNANSNSKLDFYATPNSANTTGGFMSSTTCSLTDLKWASCGLYVPSGGYYTALNNCTNILNPGNYSLQNNLYVSQRKCMIISTDNVTLSCAGHSLSQASTGSETYAIFMQNRSNVSVANCKMSNFRYGIYADNSANLNISNVIANNNYVGILLNNVKNSNILKSNASFDTQSGIMLNNVVSSSIFKNTFFYDRPFGTGITVTNSTHNMIYNNTGVSNYKGMSVNGTSRNNTIYNNTFQLSIAADYSCNSFAGDINSQNNGINYGAKKLNCYWLAALQTGTAISCPVITSSNPISITSDYIYPMGAVCYSVYANDTTINCLSHTMIATHGGVFVMFKNSSRSTLENCYLKGFTKPVETINSHVALINDTFS